MDLSAGALFAGSIVSALGVGFFIYGRRQRRASQLVAGVLLLIAPFVGGPGMIYAAGGFIVLALWLAGRFGI